MKFICERQKIDDALAVVIGRTKNKQKIPVLAHVLLDVRPDAVEITATDLDAEIRATLPADVSATGQVLVPADHLYRLVKGFPVGGQVSVEADDARATIKCGRSTYRLPTLPASDWPSMSEIVDGTEFTFKPGIVKRMFDLPQIAVSTDKARQYLHGGYLHQSASGKVALVATDAFLLVCVSADASFPLRDGKIIPRDAMAEIVKLSCEGMTFAVNANLISVRGDTFRFTSKLVDATYPSYERIIPDGAGSSLLVDRQDFAAALKRLALIGGDNPHLVFSWPGPGDKFSISINGEGSGEEIVSGTVDMLRAGGIAFAPRYLLPPLDLFTGKTLRIVINDPNGAVRLIDDVAPDLTIVVMPVKHKEAQQS